MASTRKLVGEKVTPSTSRRRRQLMDDLVRETDEEFHRTMTPNEHGEIPSIRWPDLGVEITPEEEAALRIPGELNHEVEDNVFFASSDNEDQQQQCDSGNEENDVHIWPEGFECMENLSLQACLEY
ncbi:hypothetical protein ZHAS_00001593 [Anopheles sinensis]|uniref:Uncharacterized protein n=1 Tax=Anopheles sinensis TaxID=74873 RepID=A0A084WV02_ANOSI|nr:hypothetical protein ZHAS_00001593 [Anopheles sinensis]